MTIDSIYQIFLKCQSVTTDSRNCPKNSLFIALKGESFDGNLFAAQALEKGCSYVIVDNPEYYVEKDQRYLLVDDTLKALQELATHHRQQINTPIIGITGTNGKTTTKELIACALSTTYNILYTQGNLNNHIGVPLTLLQLKKEHEIAVIEMGANHPGEIAFLAQIAKPNYGLITNVGKAHLEGFGSFEGVIKTKGELYDFLRLDPQSVVFIHHENKHLETIAKQLTLIEYGTHSSLYINGEIANNNSPFLSLIWKKGERGNIQTINSRLIGDYNLPNVLAAIAIATYFNISPEKINQALENYTPKNNRSQLKVTKSNSLIIDAYNANPTSMMAALENFKKIDTPHKMLILGDMKELGTESLTEHQKIVDYLTKCQFEKIWLVGEQFSSVNHSFRSYQSAQDIIEELKQEPIEGHTILIKGSNSTKLYTIVDYL